MRCVVGRDAFNSFSTRGGSLAWVMAFNITIFGKEFRAALGQEVAACDLPGICGLFNVQTGEKSGRPVPCMTTYDFTGIGAGSAECAIRSPEILLRSGIGLSVAAFADPTCNTGPRMADGNRAAWVADVEGTHAGPVMENAPSGKQIVFPSREFCRIDNGRIAEGRVNVDIPSVPHQPGRDDYAGRGWERMGKE